MTLRALGFWFLLGLVVWFFALVGALHVIEVML